MLAAARCWWCPLPSPLLLMLPCSDRDGHKFADGKQQAAAAAAAGGGRCPAHCRIPHAMRMLRRMLGRAAGLQRQRRRTMPEPGGGCKRAQGLLQACAHLALQAEGSQTACCCGGPRLRGRWRSAARRRDWDAVLRYSGQLHDATRALAAQLAATGRQVTPGGRRPNGNKRRLRLQWSLTIGHPNDHPSPAVPGRCQCRSSTGAPRPACAGLCNRCGGVA